MRCPPAGPRGNVLYVEALLNSAQYVNNMVIQHLVEIRLEKEKKRKKKKKKKITADENQG